MSLYHIKCHNSFAVAIGNYKLMRDTNEVFKQNPHCYGFQEPEWTTFINSVILSVIHHRQNPLDKLRASYIRYDCNFWGTEIQVFT
jgi:hypothetical protein